MPFAYYLCPMETAANLGLLSTDVIVARATPPGSGALAILRLSGTGSWQMIFQILDRPIPAPKSHRVYFRNIIDDEAVLDEVLITLFAAGKSFTGDESVEISVHGSEFIVARMQMLLVEQGARLAAPGEFSQRAFLNGKLDLAQAEAIADVIASEHEAAHRVAMQQLKGGFSRELADLREQLLHYVSLMELELDFGEEDVEFADRNQLKLLIADLYARTQRLYSSFQYGNAIKQGFQLVLAGRPNAGKSTLFNALLNEDRAIVSDIAGTTRDSIEDRLVVDGMVLRLIDTAGIREATDVIEQIGIARTMAHVEKGGATLYLFDPSEMGEEDLKVDLAMLSKARVLFVVANKVDVLADGSKANWEKFFEENDMQHVFWISARAMDAAQIQGFLGDVTRQLLELFEVPPDQTVVTNLRHAEALLRAMKELEAVAEGLNTGLSGDLMAFHIRGAIKALGEITGIIDVEEILGSIFSRFCIGK